MGTGVERARREPSHAAAAAAGVPRAVRITRLTSRPGMGSELVNRCRRIATRERRKHPGAYHVVQARQRLDGDRIELLSITEWIDLGLMASLMPAGPHEVPAFWDEYGECVESWAIEVLEVTYPLEGDPVD